MSAAESPLMMAMPLEWSSLGLDVGVLVIAAGEALGGVVDGPNGLVAAALDDAAVTRGEILLVKGDDFVGGVGALEVCSLDAEMEGAEVHADVRVVGVVVVLVVDGSGAGVGA